MLCGKKTGGNLDTSTETTSLVFYTLGVSAYSARQTPLWRSDSGQTERPHCDCNVIAVVVGAKRRIIYTEVGGTYSELCV